MRSIRAPAMPWAANSSVPARRRRALVASASRTLGRVRGWDMAPTYHITGYLVRWRAAATGGGVWSTERNGGINPKERLYGRAGRAGRTLGCRKPRVRRVGPGAAWTPGRLVAGFALRVDRQRFRCGGRPPVVVPHDRPRAGHGTASSLPHPNPRL